MYVCKCVFVGLYVYDRTVSKNVSTSTSVVPPDRLPPSLSTSTLMNTPDPWLTYLSVFLRENERTAEKTQTVAHDGNEPATEGDILME